MGFSFSTIKSVADWLMGLGQHWAKWREGKERKKSQNSVPKVVKWMEEIEQKIRNEQNVWGYSPVFEDADWWGQHLPGVLPDVIEKAVEIRSKQKERISQQYSG